MTNMRCSQCTGILKGTFFRRHGFIFCSSDCLALHLEKHNEVEQLVVPIEAVCDADDQAAGPATDVREYAVHLWNSHNSTAETRIVEAYTAADALEQVQVELSGRSPRPSIRGIQPHQPYKPEIK